MLNEIVCILHMQKEREGMSEREALEKSAIHTCIYKLFAMLK